MGRSSVPAPWAFMPPFQVSARRSIGSSLVVLGVVSLILVGMQLLIVRHAEASDPLTHAGTDATRALTAAGRVQARGLGRLLATLLPRLDVLAASPLLRARETAAFLSEAFPATKILELPVLSPGVPVTGVLDWLVGQGHAACVAIVGHEPDLSRLANLLLSGRESPIVALDKGAACLLDLGDVPTPGRGLLHALLPPSVSASWPAT